MNTNLPFRIKSFNANRDQNVLPLKYKAIAENPFRFFRGTCHLFYEDLLKENPFPSSPLSWICGDLHIENFGSYKGEDREVYFDLNDFDEALSAPILFEIARLLVSVEVAGAEIRFTEKEKGNLIQQLLHNYRHTLAKNKIQNIEKETATGIIKNLVTKVEDRKEKDLVEKRTDNQPKNAKLLLSDRLLPLPENEKKNLAAVFTEWFNQCHQKKYTVTDSGFRIAGTGSIGVKRYACLLENEVDPMQKKIIDIKQALPSSILKYTSIPQPLWNNEADRVVNIQQMMQYVSPAFISSFQYQNDWYVVKELQPTDDKVSIDHAARQPEHTEGYLSDLGMLTAAAQLRSSGKYNVAKAGELQQFAEEESWVKVLTDWSSQYAEQVKSDYTIFLESWKDGFFKP